MRRFRIALCQITPSLDKAANVERAFSMMEEAVRNGAELVALPEIFYYPFDLPRLRNIAGDEEEILQRFVNVAAKHAIHICTGSMVSKHGGERFNTSHLIGPTGEILLTYNKCHLFDCSFEGMRVRESAIFSYGNQLEVAETVLGIMGINICYDVRFPEMARQTALLGAELLIVPASFNHITGPAHWNCFMRTRAVENQFFLAAVSQGRNNDDNVKYKAYGHSMVVSPWGDILVEAGEEETIIYADIDPAVLERVRNQLPLLQHRRAPLYTSFRSQV